MEKEVRISEMTMEELESYAKSCVSAYRNNADHTVYPKYMFDYKTGEIIFISDDDFDENNVIDMSSKITIQKE